MVLLLRINGISMVLMSAPAGTSAMISDRELTRFTLRSGITLMPKGQWVPPSLLQPLALLLAHLTVERVGRQALPRPSVGRIQAVLVIM